MTKRQQLKYLICAYMDNKYRISTFCDEYSRIFFQTDWDEDAIDENEMNTFKDLAIQCERYTPFKEDILLSKYYVDDEYIHNKIIKACQQLK